MDIDRIIKANALVEAIKSAILSNTIITIRDEDTHELLWSCHTGETYGKWKKEGKKLSIDQDVNLYAVLRDIKNALRKQGGTI